jgi:hypothetical protein
VMARAAGGARKARPRGPRGRWCVSSRILGRGRRRPSRRPAPVVGALLAAVPRGGARPRARLVEEVAVRSPEATVAALRVLPRLFETARPDVVRAWFATGLRFAEERPDAASAYFGSSRAPACARSRRRRRPATLEDARGVWTKLVQMVSGTPATAAPSRGLTLRPAARGGAGARRGGAAAARGCLSHLRGELAPVSPARRPGRGTARVRYLRPIPASSPGCRDPERPALLEPFFLLAEAVRVQHRLAATYPGFAADARVLGARLLEALCRRAQREPAGAHRCPPRARPRRHAAPP